MFEFDIERRNKYPVVQALSTHLFAMANCIYIRQITARSSYSILALSYSELAIAVVGASHARRPINATRFVLLLKHQTAPNDHWRFNRHNVRLQLLLFLRLWRSHVG